MDRSLYRGNLEGTLREIQINLLECKVCFEKFSCRQRERRAQHLSCGHVLCLECVTALSHPLLRKLECPFCRQLCSVESTSPCQVLSDLQDVLLTQRHSGFAAPCRTNGGFLQPYTALRLQSCFGGWGTLINPTGIAALRAFDAVVVVHDGEQRVMVFTPQGKKLHSFGKRGKETGDVCYPVDVAVLPAGYVVVTDAGDKAVKVFTSMGKHMLTVRDSFQLPWAVDTDSCERILVSDIQAGTLSQLQVDYSRSIILRNHTAISGLHCPKAVAHCETTGNTVVVENPTEQNQHKKLKVFTKEFHLLFQLDAFSLSLHSSIKMNISGVAFNTDGELLVTDSDQGFIWSIGNLKNGPVLTPLVVESLVRPAGLVLLNDMLITLDGGDHTVKVYSAKSD